jgi:hypothetical protein
MAYDRLHGWHNIQTRAIASEIWNNTAYLDSILEFMDTYLGDCPYLDWIKSAGLKGKKSDHYGISWNDRRLCFSELDDCVTQVFYSGRVTEHDRIQVFPIVERDTVGMCHFMGPPPVRPKTRVMTLTPVRNGIEMVDERIHLEGA